MHLNFRESVRKFCEKYSIHPLSDSKRVAKPRTIRFFQHDTDKDLINTAPERDTEPMITLDIPLSKLEAIAELEAVFYNHIEDVSGRHIFATWMEQQHKEKELRDRYAAVRKAHEDYSRILAWVSNGGDPAKIKLPED